MQELKHGMRKPNKSIVKNLNGVNVIDSREVAKMVGKEHKEILQYLEGRTNKNGEVLVVGIIPTLISEGLHPLKYFIESSYMDSRNREQKCYLVTKMGCELLGNKQQGEKGILFTAKYVEAFNKMEEQVKGQAFNTSNLSKELQAIFMLDGKQQELDNRISNLEERMTIETGAQKTLCDLVNKKVIAVLGGKDAPAYKELSKKAFRQCWKNFKEILQVASYKDTPVKDFELAKKVIIDWQPNRELELMIRGCNAQIRM